MEACRWPMAVFFNMLDVSVDNACLPWIHPGTRPRIANKGYSWRSWGKCRFSPQVQRLPCKPSAAAMVTELLHRTAPALTIKEPKGLKVLLFTSNRNKFITTIKQNSGLLSNNHMLESCSTVQWGQAGRSLKAGPLYWKLWMLIGREPPQKSLWAAPPARHEANWNFVWNVKGTCGSVIWGQCGSAFITHSF